MKTNNASISKEGDVKIPSRIKKLNLFIFIVTVICWCIVINLANTNEGILYYTSLAIASFSTGFFWRLRE